MKTSQIGLGIAALTMLVVFQNCTKTQFHSLDTVEELASEAEVEQGTQTAAPTPSQPLPTQVGQQAQPNPTPNQEQGPEQEIPSVAEVFSTCAPLTQTLACPDGKPGCTCTDTLPGGTYDIRLVVRGKHMDDAPIGQMGLSDIYSPGPSCTLRGSSHSGVMVDPTYGTCNHYCSFYAKCVNGQWTEIEVGW